MASPESAGLAVLTPWRGCRFRREICFTPEAECPIDQRQLLSTIQSEIVQKDAAVLQTERAFPRGPPRNSSVRRPIGDARVHVPPAKLDFVQMKLILSRQLSQELVSAHSFRLQLQSR